MKSVAIGAQGILLGDTEVVVAGGMENMSSVPFYAEQMRWGNKYGNSLLIDGLAKDGLTDVYDGKAMGHAAELCAATCGISRQEQDAFATESYHRAQEAWKSGKFKDEVVPVDIKKKGEILRIEQDEEPFNVKFDKIAGLKPAFLKEGTVTAANASTMNDGAAALVLVSEEKLKQLGLRPLARILSYADAEQAPEWFTTSPSIAAPLAVKKAGLRLEDIDYWELNEAFAVVGIENTRRMKLNPATVNLHGGAVSIGHPLGCSGARILVTLFHILKQQKARYGAAGICNGGGGASAMVIENLS
jgi:acetyl-CoA C-acetyltransferase